MVGGRGLAGPERHQGHKSMPSLGQMGVWAWKCQGDEGEDLGAFIRVNQME